MIDLPQWGLGGAGMGNLYRRVSDEAALATAHAALAHGFGLIDTAPYYGHGRSETRVGAALARWSGPRPLLSSKVGRALDPVAPGEEGDFGFVDPMPYRPRFDYTRDAVRRSLEQSLQRLGVARLDIALVHDVGARTHGAAHGEVLRQVLDQTLPTLEQARGEGLVGAIGIGVNEWEVCVEIMARAPLDVILLAGRYTVLEQPALQAGMLDLCAARGVRVLAAGVFNSGLLASPPSGASTYDYAAAPPEVLARAKAFWDLCARLSVSPQAAAMQFPLAHPAVAGVIVGASSADEVMAQARWRAEPIPSALWDAAKSEGFLNPAAPTPRETGDAA